MGANRLIIDNSEQIANQFTYIQNQKLLTLHRCSFPGCGCYHVAGSSAYKGCQWVDYRYLWANCFQIILLTSQKMVDAVLTRIFRMELLPSCFLFRTQRLPIHLLCITVTKSLPNYLTRPKFIDTLLTLSSIFMTHHKGFSNCWLCASGLNAEWWSWLYGWSQHDAGHLYRFGSHIDHSFYNRYAITDSNIVSQFWLQFKLRVVTYLWEAGLYCVDQPSINLLWSPELSYGPYDPCTCTDELSCLTIWSLKSKKFWHVAKCIHKWFFMEIWHQ